MAKFTPYQKLSKEERQRVLLELCQAVVTAKKLPEAAKLMGDLLSEQEIVMVAKRLQIAKLLLQRKKYEEIRNALKVSQQTIARVNLWLQQAGEGFRMAMTRGLLKHNMKVPEWIPPVRRSEMARRFPLYYWPQGLLEEIIRVANNRQRQRMLETLHTIHETGRGKREIFRYVEELLRTERRNPQRRPQLEKEIVRGLPGNRTDKIEKKVP